MPAISHVKKELLFKVVYYGPGVAGKTASLQHVHRSLPDGNKGKMISLATGDDRTIFFDFLPVSSLSVRGFVTKFQLYTVPGQIYYNMTRRDVEEAELLELLGAAERADVDGAEPAVGGQLRHLVLGGFIVTGDEDVELRAIDFAGH